MTLKTETRLKGMETNRSNPNARPARLAFENRDPLKGDGNMAQPSWARSSDVRFTFENRDPLKGDGNLYKAE